MDSILAYKYKLNEALKLVPRMSQEVKLEAVDYWNDAASEFQQIVNNDGSTTNEPQQPLDSTGQQNSSYNYQQQTSDMEPSVIVDSSNFVSGPPSEQLNPLTPDDTIDVNDDPSPANTYVNQYQASENMLDSKLYDNNYLSNTIEAVAQLPTTEIEPEINLLPTVCDPSTAKNDLLPSVYTESPIMSRDCSMIASLNTNMNTCDDSQQYQLSGSPIVGTPMDSISPGASSANHMVQGLAGLLYSDAQTNLIHDIGNGQYDRGPPRCSSGQADGLPQQDVMLELDDETSCAKPSSDEHTCEICGKSGFSTKGNLKRHQKAHKGEKPFKCSQEGCESKFTEKKSLKIHMRRHTGEKPYKCDICDSSFSQTGVLKSHQAIHNETRKFKCDKCGKAFRQRSQLKLHLMRHDGIKKLECSRCGAKFLTKGDLERHFRIHTGERPYSCKMCPKTFTRQQSLNEHINRHQGKKPFTCKYCDKTFSEMSASYKHAKIHQMSHTV